MTAAKQRAREAPRFLGRQPSASRVSAVLTTATATLLLVAGPLPNAGAKTSGPKIYSPWRLEDLEALAEVLKKHVALVEIEPTIPHDIETLDEPTRQGYGVVIGPRRIAMLSFLAEGARTIRVSGPRGRPLEAQLLVYDIERRVAVLETRAPLKRAGLEPAPFAPRQDRQIDQSIFALVSTLPQSGVLHGTLTDLGEVEELDGIPHIDLRLVRGMPVFDERARLVGFSRTVAWDLDPFMIVPAEKILSAESATAAARTHKKHDPKALQRANGAPTKTPTPHR